MNILSLIGNTPIIKAEKFNDAVGGKAQIFAKLEAFNPAGSIKDRVAKAMIENAIKTGKIHENSVIIEPTSGNTGIGLCMLCSYYNLDLIIVMPENMSRERQDLMRAYGAKILLTPKEKGMNGAINEAVKLCEETENSFMPLQFENENNPMAHYLTTGPEIYGQMDKKVDIIVCGVGTGGTVSGIGKFLKEKNKAIKIIAVEPEESAVLSGEKPSPHGIQGIGAGFIPKILDMTVIDEVIKVSTQDARSTAKVFSREEAFLCGISSGAALFAASKISKLDENAGKNIVVILPDGGERYMSMGVFE